MASLIPLGVFLSLLIFFYYIFSTNPRNILDYGRIPMMILALVVVFGILIFIEYYSKPVFEGDSLPEMGENFMRFLYTYGCYIAYFSIGAVIALTFYGLIRKGFVYSSRQSPWIPLGLIFLLLSLLHLQLGTTPFHSGFVEFIRNVILYIPCIFTDLIEFMKKDYANTPSTSLIVMAILLVYVFVFYLIPFIYKVQYRNDGIQLIYEEKYLNQDPLSFSTDEINNRILQNRPFYDRWFQQILLQKMERAEKVLYETKVEEERKPPWIVPPDDITRAYYEGFTSLGNEDKQLIPYEVFKRRVEKDYDYLPPFERYAEYIRDHPSVMYAREKMYYIYASGYAALDALLYTLPKSETALYYYHYSLTSWVYLEKIETNEYQLIYSFGTRPSLYFDPIESALLVILDYGLVSQRILYKTTTVLFQRWNYIVMNYNYGSLDLFINNNLVGTYPDILTVLRPDDILVVGSRENKNIGGICNMKYYELPLSIRKIDQIYQRFHRKKIPI